MRLVFLGNVMMEDVVELLREKLPLRDVEYDWYECETDASIKEVIRACQETLEHMDVEVYNGNADMRLIYRGGIERSEWTYTYDGADEI